VYSFHLQYAFPNCPIAECLIMSPKADKIVPYVRTQQKRVG
jgi:L-rhamnonate dehydratase